MREGERDIRGVSPNPPRPLPSRTLTRPPFYESTTKEVAPYHTPRREPSTHPTAKAHLTPSPHPPPPTPPPTSHLQRRELMHLPRRGTPAHPRHHPSMPPRPPWPPPLPPSPPPPPAAPPPPPPIPLRPHLPGRIAVRDPPPLSGRDPPPLSGRDPPPHSSRDPPTATVSAGTPHAMFSPFGAAKAPPPPQPNSAPPPPWPTRKPVGFVKRPATAAHLLKEDTRPP